MLRSVGAEMNHARHDGMARRLLPYLLFLSLSLLPQKRCRNEGGCAPPNQPQTPVPLYELSPLPLSRPFTTIIIGPLFREALSEKDLRNSRSGGGGGDAFTEEGRKEGRL